MHLTILTLGSRGDVQPFAGLGQALQRAGFTIRLATHANFASLAEQAGLEFAAVEGNPQDIVQGEAGREWMETQHNGLAFARGFRELMGPVLKKAMQDSLQALAGTDALLFGGPAYYIGYSLAQKLNIPCLQGYLQPVHPTGEFPSALFPLKLKGGAPANYLSHITGGMIFWQLLRPVVNQARREYLDLPPLSWIGPFPEMNRRKIPVYYGYSPSLVPKPKNWGDFTHVTGYWFLDHSDWTPPADLVDFLKAGPPPVYVGFGSMAGRDPERLTTLTLDALRLSGRRGLLLTGWGGLAQSDLPETVYKIDSAPHDWLFPRMAAVVHHGGAGTTAAGLAAGRPTVVLPFFGDQMFWGQRVYQAGCGPAPLDRKTLTAESFAEAIRYAAGSETVRQRAEVLGRHIRAEDGAPCAAALITDYLSARPG